MKMNKRIFAMASIALLLICTVYGIVTWYFTSQTIPFHISVYGITGMAWQLSDTPGTAFSNYANKINTTSLLNNGFGLTVFFENFYNLTERLDVTVPSDIQSTIQIYAYEAFVAIWKESKFDMGSSSTYYINHVTFMDNSGNIIADWTYKTLDGSGSSPPISDPTVFRDISACVNLNNMNPDSYVKLLTDEKSRIMYDSTIPIYGEGHVVTLNDANSVVIFIVPFTEYVHPGEFDCTLAVKMGTDR